MSAYRWTGTAFEPVDWTLPYMRRAIMPRVFEDVTENAALDVETYELHLVRRDKPFFECPIYLIAGQALTSRILAVIELQADDVRLEEMQREIDEKAERLSFGELMYLQQQVRDLKAQQEKKRSAMEQETPRASFETRGVDRRTGSQES